MTQSSPQSRPADYTLLTIGGRQIRAARWRAKGGAKGARPLLLFNGIGANIEVLSPLADWVTDRDVVTFDMPGVGGSPPPQLPYRPWMMARLTMRVLDRFEYDRVDVMGVSWGGAMAQQFAFQHPSRVGKLVLVATSPGTFMVPGDFRALSKMAHPRRYYDPGYMMDNFQALYGDDKKAPSAGGHASRLTPPSRRGYAYQLAAMLGWTSAPFLPFLRQKVLVMMGESDRIVPVVNGRILAALIPRARLEVFPGGHLFLVSQAQTAIPRLVDFLSEPDEEDVARAA
jgi:poly(3-hydroxyalkanoate) depolymerase